MYIHSLDIRKGKNGQSNCEMNIYIHVLPWGCAQVTLKIYTDICMKIPGFLYILMFSLFLFSDAPGGVMPYLEVDGKQLGQSMACARYVAREHGG